MLKKIKHKIINYLSAAIYNSKVAVSNCTLNSSVIANSIISDTQSIGQQGRIIKFSVGEKSKIGDSRKVLESQLSGFGESVKNKRFSMDIVKNTHFN